VKTRIQYKHQKVFLENRLFGEALKIHLRILSGETHLCTQQQTFGFLKSRGLFSPLG